MYLQLVWQIAEGAFQGRKIWDRLNVQNTNKQAEEIAHKQLSAVCHAVGVLQVRDSAELHNRPCKIGVIRKADPGYQPSNEVKRYNSIGGAPAPVQQQSLVPPAASVAAPAPAAAAAPATTARQAFGGAKPPWMK